MREKYYLLKIGYANKYTLESVVVVVAFTLNTVLVGIQLQQTTR